MKLHTVLSARTPRQNHTRQISGKADNHPRLCLLSILLIAGLMPTMAARAGTNPINNTAGTNLVFNTIALQGGKTPDGNSLFDNIDSPAVNRSGQVVFNAQPINFMTGLNDPAGLFLLGGSGLILHGGDSAPDGNGQFGGFGSSILNEAGQVMFLAGLNNTSGGNADNTGIFRFDNSGGVEIVREGDPAPDSNGVFHGFTFQSDGPVLSASGKVAFPVVLSGTSGGTTDDGAIYLFDAAGLVKVAREGDPAPEGNGEFDGFGHPVINRMGQVAINGGLRNVTGGGLFGSGGIYLFTGGSLVNLVRDGDPLPDGNGVFDIAFAPDINDAGQVAFSTLLRDAAGIPSRGLYLHNGTGLEKVVRVGDPAPDGNGAFSGFGNPVLNGAGQVAFVGSLSNTSGGATDNNGIFLWDGSTVSQIVRTGDLAPDGNGRFDTFLAANSGSTFPPEIALNGAGQVAFNATLRGTSAPGTDDVGIYATDPDGNLRKIARRGDLFDIDSTNTFVNLHAIIGPRIVTGSGGQDGRAMSFNDQGVLVFHLRFGDTSGLFSAFFSRLRIRPAGPVHLAGRRPPPDTSPRPSFQGLGHLGGGIGIGSDAFAISGDGLVAAGQSLSPTVPAYEGFRWTADTGMIGVGSLAGNAGIIGSVIYGASDHGSVLVGQSAALFGIKAVRWTAATGMVSLGFLPGGSVSSAAKAVSADGSVAVGGSDSASGNQAFLWRAHNAMVGLGDLSGGIFNSSANGVSADGSVVVGQGTSASGVEAFRWTAADGMVGLGDLSGGTFFSVANGVSADGSVVVGTSDSDIGPQPFLWTAAGGMVGLGALSSGPFSSSARAVSADGSVVVGSSNGRAFIWDATHGMRLLEDVLVNDLGLDIGSYHLREATGISDDGRTIVGKGTAAPSPGDPEAWIARLP